MSRNLRPRTAKIIPFPLQPRAFAPHPPASVKPAEARPAIEWGSGWYHQCAIEEAARERKP